MLLLLRALDSSHTTIRKAAGHVAVYIGLFILTITSLLGQSRPGPCFNANITRGCVPLTVQVSNCSNDAEGPTIAYNYGVGGFTNAATFTYTQPGKYTVSQIGNFTSSKGGDTLSRVDYIEVLATPPPAFVLSTCAGRIVEVKITDTNYDSYLVNFGDGTSQVTAPTTGVRRTYPDVSPRTITVTGQHITQPANLPCAGASSSQMVTPIQGLVKPLITNLIATDATNLTLSYQTNAFLNYKVFQKTGTSGAYQEIAAANNPQTNPLQQAVMNVDISSQVYNFQVAAVDICGGRMLSDEISSVLLTTRADNNQNVLSWQINTSPLLQKFIIYRNGQVLTELANSNQRTYTDANVSCPTEYCYQVVAQYSNNAQSFSLQSCVRAISTDTPPAIQLLTASILNTNFASLTWQAPAGQEAAQFIILRSDNGGPFRELDRTSSTTYLDNKGNPVTPANTYCYRIIYTNTCGNTSAQSIPACPVLLTKNTTGNSTQLTWTAYQQWPGGVREYVIERLDEQGNVYDSQPNSTNLSAQFSGGLLDTTRQTVRFRVQAVPVNIGLPISYSNIIELVQPVQVHLPDAFTPNGNTLNDTFKAKGLFISEYTLTIYSRWGEVVFQSNSLEEGWSGQYQNTEAPTGKYVYAVRVKDSTGRFYSKEGTVFLIR